MQALMTTGLQPKRKVNVFGIMGSDDDIKELMQEYKGEEIT
jgi:hypothetical protein